jgi:hypothetical protein
VQRRASVGKTHPWFLPPGEVWFLDHFNRPSFEAREAGLKRGEYLFGRHDLAAEPEPNEVADEVGAGLPHQDQRLGTLLA